MSMPKTNNESGNSSNNKILSSYFRPRKYLVVVGFVILVAISFSPLIEISEQRLATHMIFEHAVFFLIGALSVMSAESILNMLSLKRRLFIETLKDSERNSLIISNNTVKISKSWVILLWWSKLIRSIYSYDRTGILWIAIAIILMVLWHYPPVFNTAAVDVNIHIIQHFSFIIVGATGFIALRMRGESFRIFLLIAIIGMMGFVGLLFSVLDQPVYDVYPVWQHNEAGAYMIITSVLLLLVVLPYYLIRKTILYVKSMGANSKL
jgi:cytochrome c oxidase assembly factor CtaG